jgi:hypothetical protein
MPDPLQGLSTTTESTPTTAALRRARLCHVGRVLDLNRLTHVHYGDGGGVPVGLSEIAAAGTRVSV